MRRVPTRMHRATRSVTKSAAIAVLWCALAGSSGLAAQANPSATVEPSAASTVWYAFTLGSANARLNCGLCQPAWDRGATLSAAMGGYATKRLRLGLEGSRWTHDDPGARETILGLGMVAYLVPNPARGLFLIAGAGWSGYRAGDFSYDAPRLTIGAGWEVPLSARWVASPVVAVDASAFAPLKNGEDVVVEGVAHSSLRFALELRRR